MPNIKGRAATTKKGISKNISAERRSGKPIKQSIAIGYSIARQERKKLRSRSKK